MLPDAHVTFLCAHITYLNVAHGPNAVSDKWRWDDSYMNWLYTRCYQHVLQATGHMVPRDGGT